MASVANINELGGYTLNPRGNLWFNDESTFGQKMLMKMGWSKGKGLGKNEDGIKENLKVKFKCTNGGLGYKDQSYDNIMKGEYESILKNLSAEYSRNNIPQNADESENGKQKFKTVKKKIRYPKLFYGKDVSKYSDKDMKSIFLCTFPVHKNEDKELTSNNSVSSCLADSKKELPKLLESYNSQLSVSDYFTLKMEQKKGNKLKKELSREINQDYSNIMSNETENSIVISDWKKNKKRKKKLINLNADLSNLERDETECEKISNKKRRKISEDIYPEGFSDDNCLEAINSTQNDQSITPNKKRKKSHKPDSISTNDDEASIEPDGNFSALPPPNKKRKKLIDAEISECDENVELLTVNAIKQGSSNGNNEAQNESSSNSNTNTKKSVKLKNKLKTLKSCLKNKKSKFSFKNVSFNENISYKIIDSRFEAENKTPICIDIDQCDSSAQDTSNNYELQKDSNDKTCIQNESFSTENESDNISSSSVETICLDKTECDGNEHSETDLPSSKSTHYNSWIESQKLALKMKMYKNMLKNIKKHTILKTTNMLSIKGYGNWGYK